MGSTNKTTNLQLPQWIGTDKPTFLGDLNDAFLKIDNGYGTIDGNATTAVSQAGQAVSKATEALEKAETAQSTAETAQQTANSANSTSASALQTANTVNSKVLQMETDNEWVSVPIVQGTSTGAALVDNHTFCYYNKGLNLLNLVINYTSTGSINFSNNVIAKLTLPFTLPTKRTIYGGCTRNFDGGGSTLQIVNFEIETNGNVVTPANLGNLVNINIIVNTAGWGIV